MPEGRTRGKVNRENSDTGGVAQQFTSARLSYPPPPRFQCDAAGVGFLYPLLREVSSLLCSVSLFSCAGHEAFSQIKNSQWRGLSGVFLLS